MLLLKRNCLILSQVHLQTQQEGKLGILPQTINIIKKQGVLALYNGLSASILRQLTYSTTRFGIYEVRAWNILRNMKSFRV